MPRLLFYNMRWNLLKFKVSESVLKVLQGFALLVFVGHVTGCIYTVIVRHEVDDLLRRHTSLTNVWGSDLICDHSGTRCQLQTTSSWLPPPRFLSIEDNELLLGHDLYLFFLLGHLHGIY